MWVGYWVVLSVVAKAGQSADGMVVLPVASWVDATAAKLVVLKVGWLVVV